METSKITFEDFIKAEALRRGKTATDFTKSLIKLGVDDGLFIAKADWKLKSPPSDHLQYVRTKYSYMFKTKTLADGSGWMIIRVH